MKQIVRTAIIGAGGIARGVHLPALSENPRCKLDAVCDLVEAHAQKAADQYGIDAVYTDYRAMIADRTPDAALILVEPDQVFRIAAHCLSAGVPCLIEKPAGVTAYQAETLSRIAREKNVLCQVGFNRRFIPLVREAIARLRKTGPIHQVDGWFFKNGDAAFYGGCGSALVCDVVHVIDLIRHIAGGEAVRTEMLSARCGDSPVDNAWSGLIQFDNGVMGTFRSNYQTGGRVHGFAVHTSRASAYLDLGFGGAACNATLMQHREGTFSLSSGGAGKQSIEHLDALPSGEPYHRYYGYYDEDAAFLEAVLSGAPSPCDISDAVQTMRLIEQLLRSDSK